MKPDASTDGARPPARSPLATQVARLIGLLTLVMVVGLSLTFAGEYLLARNQMVEDTHGALSGVASTLAASVDGADHASWASIPRDDFVRWADAPASIREMHALFLEVETRAELGTPIYSLRLRDSHRAQVLAAPDRRHPHAMEFLLTSAVNPYWRHTYDYRPDMAPTLFQGRASVAAPYDDAHGSWVSAYAPIRDAAGAIVGLVEADRRLGEFEQALFGRLKLRWLIEAVGLGVLLVLCYLYARRTLSDIVRLEQAAARMAAGRYETAIESKGLGGATRSLMTTLEALRKTIVASLAAADDIGRARSSFLARMSHEIRTPMNGVLGLSRHLRAVAASPETRETAGHIEDAAQHLLSVINQILEVSRLEAGAVRIDRAPVELACLMTEVETIVRPIMLEKGLVFASTLAPDVPPTVVADGPRIRQILLNLLGNAAKYTAQGQVSLDVRRVADDPRPGALRIVVADTGQGIDPEVLPHLFDPYRRDDARVGGQEGAGLGLSITAEIVKLMDGAIAVESTPDAGTTFTIDLVLPPTRARARATGPMTDLVPFAGHVLVVDDNAVNRMVAEKSVARLGATVCAVESGEHALGRLGDERFDCCLLDLHMPGIDGVEVVKRIRAMPDPIARMPVIIVTAAVGPEERARCLDAGADGVILKPFALRDLHAELHRCVGAG